MWGSNKEGFTTTAEAINKNIYYKLDFENVDKLKSIIKNEILKNDGTFTETFINCKV